MVSSRLLEFKGGHRCFLLAFYSALVMCFACGCGVLNPSLIGSATGDAISSLDNPEGTIIIVVMNSSLSTAAASFTITKSDGGVVDLVVPVLPADGNPADDGDVAMVVQDCDVQSIQLNTVLASLPTGDVQQFASDLAPLVKGERLSCGKVVSVMIVGVSPNLLVNLAVY